MTQKALWLLVVLGVIAQNAWSQGSSAALRKAVNDLNSKDAVTRGNAAATLGAMGKAAAPAVPILIKLLSDEGEVFAGTGIPGGGYVAVFGKNTTVSDVAATALGQIGDSRAVQPLCAFMLNKSKRINWLARASAAKALGAIGDARAVPSLLQAAVDRDDYSTIAENATDSLAQIGAPAVKPLTTAATSKNPALQKKAVAVLGRIGAPAVPSLANLMKGGTGAEIARLAALALGETREPEALEALSAALRDPKAGTASDAVAGLKVFCANVMEGGKRLPEDKIQLFVAALRDDALEPVTALFGDKTKPVDLRRDAATVMEYSRNPRAVEPLCQAMSDKNERIAFAAFYAVCTLCRFSSHNNPWFACEDPAETEQWKKQQADLLAALQTHALQPLIRTLDSNAQSVPSAAQNALHNLTGQRFDTRAGWEQWLQSRDAPQEPPAEPPPAETP